MGGGSELVTVTCPDHHQTLINGLWDFLQCNYGVDFNLKCADREVGAHRLILDLFLTPHKLMDTVAGQQPSQQPDNRSEIDCLLQFLYRGTVTVPKTQLGILLELARQSEFQMLVDALESTSDVRNPEQANQKPNLLTSEVQNRCIPSKTTKEQVEVSFIAENRQSVIETEDDHGTIIVKTEDEYVYESPGDIGAGVHSVNQSPEMEIFDWGQQVESEADCYDTSAKMDDGIIGSYLMGEKDFLSTADHHNPQGNSRARFVIRDDEVDPNERETRFVVGGNGGFYVSKSASHEQIPLIINDIKQEPTDHEQIPLIINDIKQEPTDHELDHTIDSLEHRCPVCSKLFSRISSLRRHTKMMHNPDNAGKGTFRCDECQMVFCRVGHLKRHQMTHLNKRPFPCHLCVMTFRQRSHVKQHLRKSHGELPYKCAMCDLAFDNQPVLKRHLATHQEPYKCRVCESSFSDPSKLMIHFQNCHPNNV